VAAAGFAIAEDAPEFVAIAEPFGEQALEREFGRGAQPARARRAFGAAGEFQRERGDVGIGGCRRARAPAFRLPATPRSAKNRRIVA
jgi:hypothetical protein